jgi:hypothetical protein
MPKTRTTTRLRSPRSLFAGFTFAGGNGEPAAESDAERFARIEAVLERMQQVLDTQLRRMGEMQVAIDRLLARTPSDRD